MKIITRISMTAAALIIAILLSATPSMAQESVFGVQLTPSKQTISRASNPAPPADAEQKTSIGSDSTTIGTGNSPTDTDSYWVETIDVDGNGDIETASLVWDDEDKVLFLYYQDDFTCIDGSSGSGTILMGMNGTDNPRKKPAGSGFYIVSLDPNECGATETALWGCKFDADGNETACGIAVLDADNDDIVIVTVSEQ